MKKTVDVGAVRTALHKASTDLFHWIALAERQRKELPRVDFLPCGPNEEGIRESERIRERLREASKLLAGLPDEITVELHPEQKVNCHCDPPWCCPFCKNEVE